MKERPIPFSAQMVRALLAGSKTQTRRAIKPQPVDRDRIVRNFANTGWDIGRSRDSENAWRDLACPYGVPGDRLWVREAFKPIASGQVKSGEGVVRYGFAYKADGATVWRPNTTRIVDLTGRPDTGPLQFRVDKWKPGIHMPRAACRIKLEITEVRVQRLQEISDDDCCAEGADGPMCAALFGKSPLKMGHCERVAYAALWDQINGAGAWDANPWVWAVSFKRIEGTA